MKITYDADVDAVYISLTGQSVAETKRLNTEVAIDFDANGTACGIELLFASEWVENLQQVLVENITRPHPSKP